MTTEASISPYELMAEQALPDDRLPTADELEEVYSTLHGVFEHLTDPIQTACARLGNSEEPGGVTFEQIGQLLAWVDDMLAGVRYITRDVEDIALIARAAFPALAHGYRSDGVPFSESGYVDKPAEYERLRRAYGFRDPS